MSYSDQERLRLRAKEALDVPLESRRATTPEGHGHPRVYCELQQLKERRELGLDNTLSETFPCSDPLSSIPDPASHSF
jgi:hypothetical protein